jgi:hypothetical protein
MLPYVRSFDPARLEAEGHQVGGHDALIPEPHAEGYGTVSP